MVLIEIDFSAPNIILFVTLLAILRMSSEFVFAAQVKGVRQQIPIKPVQAVSAVIHTVISIILLQNQAWI
jgi:hypothetical protein